MLRVFLLYQDEDYNKVSSEISKLMEGKTIFTLDAYPLAALQPYFTSKDYIGNIIFLLGEAPNQFYLVLHFTKDSPFTGYTFLSLTKNLT